MFAQQRVLSWLEYFCQSLYNHVLNPPDMFHDAIMDLNSGLVQSVRPRFCRSHDRTTLRGGKSRLADTGGNGEHTLLFASYIMAAALTNRVVCHSQLLKTLDGFVPAQIPGSKRLVVRDLELFGPWHRSI